MTRVPAAFRQRVAWLAAVLALAGPQPALSAARAEASPVLIVGGTVSPEPALAALACRLRADGFDAFTATLPGLGLGDIAASARSLAVRVDAIRATTGAAKVDLIGHSQGGLAARYYLKFLGGADGVGTYVSLGTPQYGTVVASVARLTGVCLFAPACRQMALRSTWLADLNAGDDTPGAPRYVAIYSALDALVPPFGVRLAEDALNVNFHAHCPLRPLGHVGLLLDGAVYGLVRSALEGEAISTDCFAF